MSSVMLRYQKWLFCGHIIFSETISISSNRSASNVHIMLNIITIVTMHQYKCVVGNTLRVINIATICNEVIVL